MPDRALTVHPQQASRNSQSANLIAALIRYNPVKADQRADQ
jgi:hypothetical protein